MGQDADALIRQLYATWNDEGVEAFRTHCTEDVAWHDDPRVPDATTSRGTEGVVSRFEGLIKTIGQFQIDVQELGDLEDGRHYSVVSVTVRGQESGAVVEDDHLHVLRLEDGLVAEFWLHLDVERPSRPRPGGGLAASPPRGPRATSARSVGRSRAGSSRR